MTDEHGERELGDGRGVAVCGTRGSFVAYVSSGETPSFEQQENPPTGAGSPSEPKNTDKLN